MGFFRIFNILGVTSPRRGPRKKRRLLPHDNSNFTHPSAAAPSSLRVCFFFVVSLPPFLLRTEQRDEGSGGASTIHSQPGIPIYYLYIYVYYKETRP